jgi:hypothetical protein
MEGFIGDRRHKRGYAAGVEIEVVPEPGDDERAALEEALRLGEDTPAAQSEWRRAALHEGVEASEP